MSYKTIYRKFRPTTFEDVLGQEHITQILKNQIRNDNIAHAYLFSGTRGTGKTSTARIFARAINCESEVPPCNTCEMCEAIINDTVMDIIEIDAASNNSVEDIRDLRENSKYPPSKCRYKVYVIDEVHMLSKGAFNALLKILEEPPVHLVFVLATTEPEKLPATILSRCQRYDFKRVSVAHIVENMRKISKQVEIEVEEDALELIARNSDGAMRDALSILDQCMSFTDSTVTSDYVIKTLGIVNNDLMFDVVDDIIKKDTSRVLESVDSVIREGVDVRQFIKDLILHFRNLMVAKASSDVSNSIDGTDEFKSLLVDQARDADLSVIIESLNILSETENKAKWSTQPKVILEVDLIKLMSIKSESDINSLFDRIKSLEEELKSFEYAKREARVSKLETKEPEISEVSKSVKSEVRIEKSQVSTKVTKGTTDIEEKWPEILKQIKVKKIALHALIKEGKILSFRNNVLTISFKEGFSFHRDALDKEANRVAIQDIIGSALDEKIELRLVMDEKKEKSDSREDLLRDVIEVFGEDLIEVEN